MNIYTIGDSHAYKGWDELDIPGVRVFINWLGPKLMYSFSKDGFDVRPFAASSGDLLVFCFGEIDARCHIHQHVSENFRAVIDLLVGQYINTIKVCQSATPAKVGVYFIPPAVRKLESNENLEYPFVGSDDERCAYARYMNEKLKDECAKNGLLFIDLFDKYSDESGFLRRDMSDHHVHIKNIEPLAAFIRSLQ